MPRQGLAAALLLACTVFSPVAHAEQHGAKQVDEAWIAAAKAGNVDAAVALYARDATLYPPSGTEEAKGTAAIRKYYTDWFGAVSITDATIVATYETVGDLSAGHGIATLTYSLKSGGSPLVMSVRVTAVARRIDGKWLYVADHASVPAK